MVATGGGGATNRGRKKKNERQNIAAHRQGHSATSNTRARKGGLRSSSSGPSTMTTRRNAKTNNAKLVEFVILAFILPAVVTFVTSIWWKPMPFIGQLLVAMCLDSVYGAAISTLLQPIAFRLAARIYEIPDSSSNQYDASSIQNDPTILWPSRINKAEVILPEGWKQLFEKRMQQLGQQRKEHARSNHAVDTNMHDEGVNEPLYFLNHVGGYVRLIQACVRISHGLGTIVMVYVVTCCFGGNSDNLSSSTVSLSTIGLQIEWNNLGWGFLVGSLVVIVVIFVTEILLGWIHIIGYCEVARTTEPLLVNLFWDVLFHIGVSINEEVSLRGWIFIHSVACLLELQQSDTELGEDVPVFAATGIAILFQALVFAFLHVHSPGASTIGLFNLVVGGTIAALNVVISGGLSFNLGWHFGWNIWMGHFLGLSTSGIPMSAKLVSVVPHPGKAYLHGGRFGPEQSPLAPIAYLLGFVALLMIYCEIDYDSWTVTSNGIQLWKQRLAALNAVEDQTKLV